MKTIIAGSHFITDSSLLVQMIKYFELRDSITAVLSRHPKDGGPDLMGELWAIEHGIPVIRRPVDFLLHRLGGEGKRNTMLAEEAEQALILWDTRSYGTGQLLKECMRLGLPTCLWTHRKIGRLAAYRKGSFVFEK